MASNCFKEAFSAHQKGELQQAQLLYEETLKLEPQYVEALHLLGVVYYQRGDFVNAVHMMEQAINVSPNNAAIHSNLGNALKSLMRYDEALASYDRAIALSPQFADAHNNRGFLLESFKRYQDALDSFDKAISIKPDFSLAYNNRGRVLKKLNRLDEALASFDRSIGLKNNFHEAYLNHGLLLIELNDLDEALASLARAMELAKGASRRLETMQSLMLVHHLKGDFIAWSNMFRQSVMEFSDEHDSEFDELYIEGLRATGTGPCPIQRRDRFRHLVQLFDGVLRLNGMIAECGCYRGLSSYLLSSWLKCKDIKFDGGGYRIFDSFSGLSHPGKEDEDRLDTLKNSRPPKEEDIRFGKYAASLQDVKQSLSPFPGIEYFPGWIPTAFPKSKKDRYCFVHVDVDLYQPTKDSFEYFWPRMVPGGMIVCDDYNWSGAEHAVKEFCQSVGVEFKVSPYGQAYFCK